MTPDVLAIVLLACLFLLLGSGIWIALSLMGVGAIGMMLFSSAPIGKVMATAVFSSSNSWTLTALPLFIWMGEILFRTRLSRGHVQGPRAVDARGCPAGCCTPTSSAARIFAAVSGSSRRDLRHHRQDDAARAHAARLPRARWRSARSPAPARSGC